MFVAPCVLRLITFALRRLSTFLAHFAVVLLQVQELDGATGSWGVEACAGVTLGVVSMTIDARTGSDYNVHGGVCAPLILC